MSHTIIQVPGEPTLWQTHDVSPLHVLIPLRTSVRRGPMVVLSVLMALLSAACVLATLSISMEMISDPFRLSVIPGSLALVVSLVMTVYGPCIALTCLSDAMRGSPSLILEAESMRDLRIDAHFRWTNIERIRLLRTRGGGVSGAKLTFHDPVHTRWNPFRIGSVGFVLKRNSREIHIALLFQSVDPHTISQVMLALAEIHAGELEQRQCPPR